MLGVEPIVVEDEYAMLPGPGGGPALGFGTVPDYRPPAWPNEHGSKQFQFASTDQEAAELWENRKYALTSTMTAGGEGARVWTTDVWYGSST